MAELLEQARAGDWEAFASLVEPHRGELQVHCYRMLGSYSDAEDALQETLLAAWLGLDGFEGRSSLRTWLYRIATNRCLNLIRSAGRRAPVNSSPPVQTPEPSRLGEVLWLQPYPDLLLDSLPDTGPGPEARYESREAISLAFVTAVQLLPPSQRAVLLLRDVLGYRGRETAEILELSEDAVAGGLKRARATMAAARSDEPPAPPAGGSAEAALLERFLAAFTAGDVDALVGLMTEAAWLRMPPQPWEYQGKQAIHGFFTAVSTHHRRIDTMIPIRANSQPGWGEYIQDRVTGGRHLSGVLVVELAGDHVCALTRFETAVAASFGLPRMLPG